MKKENKDCEPKFYFVEAVLKEPLPEFRPIVVQLPEIQEEDPDFYICSRMREEK